MPRPCSSRGIMRLHKTRLNLCNDNITKLPSPSTPRSFTTTCQLSNSLPPPSLTLPGTYHHLPHNKIDIQQHFQAIMASVEHCLYCFEALSASLENRQPMSLYQ